MTDIILVEGDIAFQTIDYELDPGFNSRARVFDLPIENYKDMLYRLVYRALRTPVTYIGRYIVDSKGSRIIDQDYGDPIYLDLGEPATYGFMTKARHHIEYALSFIPEEVTIVDLDVRIESLFWLIVKIRVLIGNKTEDVNLNLSLQDIPEINI